MALVRDPQGSKPHASLHTRLIHTAQLDNREDFFYLKKGTGGVAFCLINTVLRQGRKEGKRCAL